MNTNEHPSLSKLVGILQAAYSGELAAAKAYNGHWKSLSDAEDRKRIQLIESEELEHRRLVGELLSQLHKAPNPHLEKKMARIGWWISLSCKISGWFIPMYGAGKLEQGNIVEYIDAAHYAKECGHPEMIECLLEMAEVEWEHEKFFREKITHHFLYNVFPKWTIPEPKSSIRKRSL